MKKLIYLSIAFFISFHAYTQEEVTKKGWKVGGILPAITYDTDLGFQYGAMMNIFDYGDGERYPDYNHSLYFEISRFTKGSGINRFSYDSDRLIKGIQTSADISFLSDQAYDFYGFNGFDAIVNKDWFDDESDDYITRMYYKYDRKLFRFKVDLTGNLSREKLKWTAGINFLNFKIGSVNVDKLNKGKDEDDLLPDPTDVPGLYEKYRDWGIFKEEDIDGGFVPLVKAGVVYDTRDNRYNPMKGVWTEAVLAGAPEFLGGESSFVKLSLIHRQYFTIIPNDLSFVYRLAYQSTIGGDVPFYYQSQVITSIMKGATSEGLGGAKSIRGIRRNRIVGDGFFMGNVETRWKFWRINLGNDKYYLSLNGFVDFGRVTKKIDVDPKVAWLPAEEGYFADDAEKMHYTYGAGLRIVRNETFILAIDYGMAADERDGDSGLYIGINYLF